MASSRFPSMVERMLARLIAFSLPCMLFITNIYSIRSGHKVGFNGKTV